MFLFEVRKQLTLWLLRAISVKITPNDVTNKLQNNTIDLFLSIFIFNAKPKQKCLKIYLRFEVQK